MTETLDFQERLRFKKYRTKMTYIHHNDFTDCETSRLDNNHDPPHICSVHFDDMQCFGHVMEKDEYEYGDSVCRNCGETEVEHRFYFSHCCCKHRVSKYKLKSLARQFRKIYYRNQVNKCLLDLYEQVVVEKDNYRCVIM